VLVAGDSSLVDAGMTGSPTRKERNAFYTQVGKLVPPGAKGRALLSAVQPDMEPGEVLSALK